MDNQTNYVDTCASADPITVALYSLGLFDTAVYTCPVLEEIVQLCNSPNPAEQQRGQQAAVTLATLQSLPYVCVTIDKQEPMDAYTDTDLLLRAGLANATILTCDGDLLQRAQAEGVRAVRVQDFYRRFRGVMPLLRKLFPPPRELAVGDTLTVQVRQLGRYDGQGLGYLEGNSQVVISGGAEYLGGGTPAVSSREKGGGVSYVCTEGDRIEGRLPLPNSRWRCAPGGRWWSFILQTKLPLGTEAL